MARQEVEEPEDSDPTAMVERLLRSSLPITDELRTLARRLGVSWPAPASAELRRRADAYRTFVAELTSARADGEESAWLRLRERGGQAGRWLAAEHARERGFTLDELLRRARRAITTCLWAADRAHVMEQATIDALTRQRPRGKAGLGRHEASPLDVLLESVRESLASLPEYARAPGAGLEEDEAVLEDGRQLAGLDSLHLLSSHGQPAALARMLRRAVAAFAVFDRQLADAEQPFGRLIRALRGINVNVDRVVLGGWRPNCWCVVPDGEGWWCVGYSFSRVPVVEFRVDGVTAACELLFGRLAHAIVTGDELVGRSRLPMTRQRLRVAMRLIGVSADEVSVGEVRDRSVCATRIEPGAWAIYWQEDGHSYGEQARTDSEEALWYVVLGRLLQEQLRIAATPADSVSRATRRLSENLALLGNPPPPVRVGTLGGPGWCLLPDSGGVRVLWCGVDGLASDAPSFRVDSMASACQLVFGLIGHGLLTGLTPNEQVKCMDLAVLRTLFARIGAKPALAYAHTGYAWAVLPADEGGWELVYPAHRPTPTVRHRADSEAGVCYLALACCAAPELLSAVRLER